ncbi:hypothetical protein CBR_g50072 [Chara braunii]|uniref:Uncharacterized protein n=1 Tax=Chara braunii TaxID=69332 RepID=A0A388M687_CHABU|nr:hypothetical protein CBR_g50072 [Chara braunii]|eukprot:GBG89982.1 hypothetical protein CBR_g50072 [Chara braunii]
MQAAAQISRLPPCAGRCATQGIRPPPTTVNSSLAVVSSSSSTPLASSLGRGGRSSRGVVAGGKTGGDVAFHLSFSQSSSLAELRLGMLDNSARLSWMDSRGEHGVGDVADRSQGQQLGPVVPIVVSSLFPFDKVVKVGTSLWSGLWGNGNDDEQREREEMMRLVKSWHTTTKGTLKKKYRVVSAAEGKRLLSDICALLSDDDTFKDAGTHKGCMIRRETAHSRSFCCKNVRALFDENPTPHLIVEISVFPDGPISDAEFQKAAKIEKVLKTGHSI